MPKLVRRLGVILFLNNVFAAFYYPTPQVAFLEHILVDNWGAHASNFSSAITPCNNYVTEVGEAAVKSGRTTAAQWMRVAFHDAVTANVTAGTGGLDASIGFETLREENSGSAFNDSFTFWRPFVNDVVSMADLVAMGTVMSMGLCGGHIVPYQAGRIDALQADPTTGVPAPETSLEETLIFFDRAGFNQPDSIGLTACGHTMGSVHHGGFPQVVPASAVTPNNTNGGMTFDTSRAIFDSGIVHEYIDWDGNKGGPLVATDNITTRSDLRLYESDGNATMQSLYDMDDGFEDVCVDLMGRMVNTVPAGVSLQETITPMTVKPINVTLDFNSPGNLVLSGNIRILTKGDPAGHVQVNVGQANDAGSNFVDTLDSEAEAGSSIYGTTTYYPFQLFLDPDITYTTLSISGSGFDTQVFPIQSTLFVVPGMTVITGSLLNITVASKLGHFSSSDGVGVVAPVGQEGTLGPKIMRQVVEVDLVTDNTGGPNGYQLWQGWIDLGVPVTGAVSVNVASEEHVQDVLYLSVGVAGW